MINSYELENIGSRIDTQTHAGRQRPPVAQVYGIPAMVTSNCATVRFS